MQILCSGCGKPVDVEPPGQPAIINLAATSLIVGEHPRQEICPSCGATVVVSVANAQLNLVAAVVPKHQQKLIVVPGRT